MTWIRSIVVTLILFTIALWSVNATAVAATERCLGTKLQTVGLATNGFAVCDAKAVSRGSGVALRCTAKVDAAFTRAWKRAEHRGSCATSLDAAGALDRTHAHDASMYELLGASGPPSRCTACKLRHAGRLALCHLACSARAANFHVSLGHPAIVACNAKCSRTVGRAFARDEAYYDCRTTDDVAFVESSVGAFVDCMTDQLGVAGSPPCAEQSTTTVPATSSTTSTSGPDATTSTTTIATTTSTTTLILCGGTFPACSGSCPPGQTCTGSVSTLCSCQ